MSRARRGAAARVGLRRAAWALPAALLLTALVVRLALVAATPDYRPARDGGQYDRLACAIVVSGSYPLGWPDASPRSCGAPSGSDASKPSAFRPPGFPAFLAAVYWLSSPVTADRWTAGRIAQAALGTLLAGLTGLLAARLWGRRAGLAALALAALAPAPVLVGGALLSDLLFATLVVAAVLAALASDRRALPLLALAGALAGLAALTRPQGLVLLAPLALAGWRARRVRGAAVVAGAALAVVTPWTARNVLQLGALVPVSTHTGESLAGTYNDVARTRPDHPGAWRPPADVPAFADVYRPGSDEVVRQRELILGAGRFAIEHPGYVLEVSVRNALRLANLHGREWWRTNARSMSMPTPVADAAAYSILGLAALALAGAVLRAARRAPAWLWFVPLLLLLSTAPVSGETRLRAAMEPFVVVLAALALTCGAERVRARRRLVGDRGPC